jgi:hypothetical protein
MSYNTFEGAVKARIEQLNTPTAICEVGFLQEAELDNKALILLPRVEVGLLGTTFEPTYNAENVIQKEKISIMVEVKYRNLRDTNGVYNIADKVKQLLIGFKPYTNVEKMQVVKTELFRIGDAQGDFVFQMEFSAVGYGIQYFVPDNSPKITQIIPNITAVRP